MNPDAPIERASGVAPHSWGFPVFFLLAATFLGAGRAPGAVIDVILQDAAGTNQTAYAGWSSVSWQPLTAWNDPNETYSGGEQLDIVGDASNPAGYWASDAGYLFFRVRLDLDTVTSAYTTFHDTHAVVIDVVGQHFDTATPANQLVSDTGTDVYPDYALAWDSKSGGGSQLKNHGLEMMVRGTTAPNWGGMTMDDLDGSSSAKTQSSFGASDINRASTTDGYLRLTDGQSTTNFGSTTYLDFAVSWGYLTANTDLRPGQPWRVGVVDIADSTDHSTLGKNGDVGGGASADSLFSEAGWSGEITPIPELSSVVWPVVLLGLYLLFGRRKPSVSDRSPSAP